MSPVSVVVVDDDPLVRSALGLMLGGQSGVEVVGEAADGRAGVELVERLRPDVVLMDIRMPVLNGLEATALLRARSDEPRIVVLTTFDADEHVVRAVAAGADGFLLKDTPPAQIVEAVHRVAEGEAMLSPSATRALVAQVRVQGHDDRARAARQRLEVLTSRELDVARAVGDGLSNAEVARALHLSVPTVKAHVSRLLEKLGTANRVQVAILVHDAGLAGQPPSSTT